jgi:hypothetical protein
MFNQKVNQNVSQNPEYLSYSYAAPALRPACIHDYGTTINRYTKASNSSSLPLQKWSSTNVAVESFAMRPIVNPTQYFEEINKYLSSIIYTDSINLKKSGLTNEHYYLLNDYGTEPLSSFIETIKLDLVEKLNYYMSATTDNIGIFKEYNPLCEGFTITDIDITTYRSNENSNHFFHKILFSAFNTTRYNTVSFKAEAYQDTTPIMSEWNNSVGLVLDSKKPPSSTPSTTDVYISMITLLNNTNCVTGQESECGFKGYNISSSFSQLLNDNFLKPAKGLYWEQPNAITQDTYSSSGNYDEDGHIRIVDYGPSNIEQLIKMI